MSTKTKSGRSAGKSPVRSGGKGPRGKDGRKPPRRVAPVKVGRDRNWGPIALFLVVGLVATGLIGWAAWAVVTQDTRPYEEQAADIDGLINWHEEHPELLEGIHMPGPIPYQIDPPAGGPHNDDWQNCQGVVYEEPIATEHAVHSLEHGAVWITYHPDLDDSDVRRLERKVRGNDFIMMSPFPGLDAPISLQAWGYQLKVDSARDGRIDDFIRALRIETAQHDGATCSGGVTRTGTVPIG